MENIFKWIYDELKEQNLFFLYNDGKFEILSGTYSCFIEIGEENLNIYCKSSDDDQMYFERLVDINTSKLIIGNIINYLVYKTREKNTGTIRIGQKISEICELMERYNIPLITVEKMISENLGEHDV